MKDQGGELSVPSTGRPVIYWPQPSPPFFLQPPNNGKGSRDLWTPVLADPGTGTRGSRDSRTCIKFVTEWLTPRMADLRNGGPPEWRPPGMAGRPHHCKCHLTIKHMLLECPSTAVIRQKYFSSTTLKELFSNVDARCILDFTESGFYQAI